MKYFWCILIVLSALNCLSFSQEHEKLHVTIYYESLCPDSVRFIRNQLIQHYDDLKEFIDILFVPFGKSHSINGGESFVCQHGPRECDGNKIQSCALNELYDEQDLQVSFVACQMHRFAEPTGESCSQGVGIDYEKVKSCFHSKLGTKLQLGAEILTKQVAPTFVPTIVYNQKFNQELQDLSQTNFVGVVCELIGYRAEICNNK